MWGAVAAQANLTGDVNIDAFQFQPWVPMCEVRTESSIPYGYSCASFQTQAVQLERLPQAKLVARATKHQLKKWFAAAYSIVHKATVEPRRLTNMFMDQASRAAVCGVVS